MAISYDSIGQVCVTCMGVSPLLNAPCKFNASNNITVCTEGDQIDGVLVAKSNTLSTVAIKGFVTLPYAGSAPTVGYCPLAVSGNTKVKVQEGAREYLVVQVDTLKKTVTFYL